MEATNKVKVNMLFVANIAIVAETERMEFQVSTDVKQAIEDIHRFFSGKKIRGLLYTVLINDKVYSHALNDGYTIAEGDNITIVPVTLGG